MQVMYAPPLTQTNRNSVQIINPGAQELLRRVPTQQRPQVSDQGGGPAGEMQGAGARNRED